MYAGTAVMDELEPEVIEDFHHTPFATPIIGVTGGKGGVGKTTVAVNLAAALAAHGLRVALVDCDVDAPNADILLGLTLADEVPVTVTRPVFSPDRCTDCGQCLSVCRLHSLFRPRAGNITLMGECNGCEACFLVCPADAIDREQRRIGATWKGGADSLTLYTGRLDPGLEEGTLVVRRLRERVAAEADRFDIIVIDTAPGIHCNVIEALKGVSLAIAVTEPTPLGSHDLDLILSLLAMFRVRGTVFVNRADLPGKIDEIEELAARRGMGVEIGLPLDRQLLDSYVHGVPVVHLHPHSSAAMTFAGIAGRIAGEFTP